MASQAIIIGDSLKVMRQMKDACIDAIVTDPPAGISFMGRAWDDDKGGRDQWIAWLASVMTECLRVLKPGGHALVWALPRTSHWTATAIEDAGFEIRDVIMHLFGTGFPKSLNVGKAIDAAAGVEREVIGPPPYRRGRAGQSYSDTRRVSYDYPPGPITAPTTSDAKKREGWGTALKPAAEHWILARKPVEGTVAANVAKYGTGGLNIDACRIKGSSERGGARDGEDSANRIYREAGSTNFGLAPGPRGGNANGRWPANVVLSHFDTCERVGTKVVPANGSIAADSAAATTSRATARRAVYSPDDRERGERQPHGNGDGTETVEEWLCADGCPVAGLGAASRYFYVAKPARKEKEAGLDHLPLKTAGEATGGREEGSAGLNSPRAGAGRTSGARNHHPTTKGIDLMRYLARLITRPGGLVLDPFAGSGTTGCAAALEGFNFIGIEKEAEYAEIARARIAHWRGKEVSKPQDVVRNQAES